MKTYKIYAIKGKKILEANNGKEVKRFYESKQKMKNGRYIGEWEQNNLEEIAKDLEAQGYKRELDQLDQELQQADKGQIVAIAKSIK